MLHSLTRGTGLSLSVAWAGTHSLFGVPLFELRLLPPSSYRRRHDPPSWEISDAAGVVVGQLDEVHLPTAGRPFYRLIGRHPRTGELIDLQLSTDRDERLRVLADFLDDPTRHAQHFPTGTRARREWEAVRPVPAWQLGTGKPGRHG